jgi:serine phosphatase RsbU (regulator of sigma subunit)/HAMP domain-containing protein
MPSDVRGWGLTGRVIRTALVSSTVLFFVAGALSLAGVYGLSSGKVSATEIGQLHAIEHDVIIHIAQAQSAAEQISSAIASGEPVASVARPYVGAEESFDRVLLVDRRGGIVEALPASAEVTPSPEIVSLALGGARRVVSEPGDPRLAWVITPVRSRAGAERAVLCRLNAAFLERILDRVVVGPESGVALMTGDQLLAYSGGNTRIDLTKASWIQSKPGSGQVRVARQRGLLTGSYADIDVAGLRWRAVTVQPASTVRIEALTAAWPTLAALGFGALAATLLAWGMAVGLTRPLRALERLARRAAEGSYVRPLGIVRDDEIGRVAEAFDAVALRLNATQDMARLLSGASQLDEVLDVILSAMEHMVGRGVSAVYLLGEGGRWLTPVAARNADVDSIAALKGGESTWAAQAMASGKVTALVASGSLLAEELPGLARPSDSAAIASPLVTGGEPLGLAVVLPDSGNTPTDAQSEMLTTFMVQAATAVANSQLFEVERRSRHVAEALRALAEQFATPRGLGDSLLAAEPMLAELFGASEATIAILHHETLGLDDSRSTPVREGIVELVSSGPEGMVTSPTVYRIGDSPLADTIMARSSATELLLVPIAAGTEHAAAFALAFGARGIARSDLVLAETVASEMALALNNAFLFERALVRAQSLETVFRISQAVGSSLQVKVVLNRVLDVVQKLLPADGVALMTYDQRTHTLTTAMARGRITASLIQDGLDRSDIPARVFGSGEPVVVRDLVPDMEGVAGEAASLDLRALVGVPLVARGRPIGVLTVFSAEAGAFSDEDVSLLRTFASQAALAIDTAKLYSGERDVSQVLQRSLAPDALPSFPEFEVGSVYAPAGGETEIGGDYYDLIRATDGSVWFAIADVCGKGVRAATKTSMIKYYVRAFAIAGYSPSAVVSEVNKAVAESENPSDIVTLLVGRLVPDDGGWRLEWANGGHPPGLLVRLDGTVDKLEPTGPLLGAVDSAVFGLSSLAIGVGETLALFTDGVVETRRGKEFFGEERVLHVLEGKGNPERVASRLLEAVRLFSQQELRDDVAILVLRVAAPNVRHTE